MLPLNEEGLTKAIEKVNPSVVSINTLRLVRESFFDVVPMRGLGSGVIIDSRGYILTNYHIVAGTERVEVTLADGRKLPGRVIGADSGGDIVVVKVDAENLSAAELGDSDKLQVGQFVAAIGSPFGFLLQGPTVTFGVVSAVKRHLHVEGRIYEDLVQTDAAINPGNSGGPLINSKGQVIGLNMAIIPFAQGIGFAIPINTARAVAEELISYGRVFRPWLGISGLTVTESIARYYDLPEDRGTVIVNIMEGSPAYEAGLRPGDVIIGLNGRELKSMDDLVRELRKRKVGEYVELQVVRGKRTGTVSVRLEEAP